MKGLGGAHAVVLREHLDVALGAITIELAGQCGDYRFWKQRRRGCVGGSCQERG
jgi:hypothetical protein